MRRVSFIAVVLVCAGGAFTDANAMPMFARKLGVGCATCHTTIPKLNETGYKFRAAGWRMPDDIGKPEDKPFNLGDYNSARIQARYDGNKTDIGPVSSHKSQFTFHEFTFYPMTGSFDKYYSSLVELSFLPEESAEVENAYVRINVGNDKRFFATRFGVFHPFEGYGASDRPVSISRPYIQTNAANFNQTTFFTPWGFDQAGAEFGIDYQRTSLRATIFNGLVIREEEGAFSAFPSQGGALAKSTSLPSAATPDFQFFANHRLTDDGGGVSLFYYHGNLDLPVGTSSTVFQNGYDRVAVYGSYPVVPKATLLGGYQWGRDNLAGGGTFSSRGAFGEVDVPVHQYATVGVRYDWFDPAKDKADNEVRGVVGFVNVPLQNGFQVIGEYQNKRTLRGTNPDRTDNLFQIRFIFIL
jgi:hypothetical protein